MATVVEQAVVELQIIVREFNRRLAGIERRLGLEHETFGVRPEQPHPITPLPPPERRTPVVSRIATAQTDLYEVAGTATLERDVSANPASHPGPDEPIRVQLSTGGTGESPKSAEAAAEQEAPRIASTLGGGAAVSVPSAQTAATQTELDVRPPKPPAPPPPAARKVLDFLARQPEPTPPGPGIEAALGMTVASWAGALAIIGSVFFFLTYAFDGRPTILAPMVRVVLAAGAGVVMMVWGLWFHRRRFGSLSMALCGSGLAALMAGLFAANLAFAPPVLSRTGAFLAILLAGAAGVGLALLTDTQVLAAMALVGAFLSPFLLDARYDHVPEMLGYLALLASSALVLAALKRTWESVRMVAFVMSWIWLIGWTNDDRAAPYGMPGLGFICGFFVLFLADFMLALTRSLAQDPAQGSPMTRWARYTESSVTVYSFFNSGAALVAGWLLFERTGMPNFWLYPLLLSATMFMVSRLMMSQPFRLGATTQSVLLLLAAIPLYFSDQGATFGYAFGALAFAVYARQTNSEFARVWMFVMLALASIRVAALDAFDPNAQGILFSVGTTAFNDWMITGWTLAVEALALAWLSRPAKSLRPDGTTLILGARWTVIACITVATVLVLLIDLWTLQREGPFTLAAIIWIFAILLLARVQAFRDMAVGLESFAAAMLLLACIKWLAYDGLMREALNPIWQHWPILNLYTLNALLLAAAILVLRSSPSPPLGDESPAVNRRFYGWWLFAVGFVLANVQALRAVDHFMRDPIAGLGTPELVKNAALTAVWGLTGAGMVMVGFGWKAASVRYVGLTLLALTLAKILFMDMAGVDTALRVLSFLLVGVLLFVVSYGYHKWQGRVAPA